MVEVLWFLYTLKYNAEQAFGAQPSSYGCMCSGGSKRAL
jgi:hypothetical protein